MKKLLVGLVLSLLAVPGWSQTYFTIFGPAAGIQKNTGATPFNTAAASSDITALWSGTCSASTFLRGDGSCAIPAGTGISSVTAASPLAASGGCSSGACSITWTATLGDIHYGSGTNTIGILAGNATSTKKFLTQTGTGSVSAAPAWATIATGDIPSLGANPSATIGLTAINGTATTYMTSDSAPALSQAISPTWTNNHVWSQSSNALVGPIVEKNTSTGTAAAVFQQLQNSTDSFTLAYTSTGYSGSLLTGGPTGEAAAIYTNGSFPLALGTTGSSRLAITATGNISVSAPSSGTALTVNAVANARSAAFVGSSTSGQSFGPVINSGTTSADDAFFITNQSGGTGFFRIFGDGGIIVGAPTGGDKGAGTLNTSSTIFQNNVPVATVTSGTATVTLTGVTTTVTGTAKWSLTGNIASITLPTLTGTSNANTLTVAGLPASITVTTNKTISVPVQVVEDNGTVQTNVNAQVTNGSVIAFTLNNSTTGFTASGAKGVTGVTDLTWGLE